MLLPMLGEFGREGSGNGDASIPRAEALRHKNYAALGGMPVLGVF
jgi:hypothetical protein